MPSFTYPGLSKKQEEQIIETNMAPLKGDYGPHPIFGGFPEKKDGNPPMYYPEAREGPQSLEIKAKRRDDYRNERLNELKEDLKKMDACRVVQGVEFPKGVAVEVSEDHKAMAKIKALVKAGALQEASEAPKAGALQEASEAPKRGRPKKEED